MGHIVPMSRVNRPPRQECRQWLEERNWKQGLTVRKPDKKHKQRKKWNIRLTLFCTDTPVFVHEFQRNAQQNLDRHIDNQMSPPEHKTRKNKILHTLFYTYL